LRAPSPCTRARVGRADDGDVEAPAAVEQALRHRAAERTGDRPLARLPDDDRGDGVPVRVVEDLVGDARAAEDRRVATQPLGELERAVEALAIGARAAGVDIEDRPRRL